VPPTARGMADGIVNLLQQPQAIEALREQARIVAATEFGWSKFCDQVRNVYEPALTKTNRALHRQAPTSGKRKVQRFNENA
jgi:glycosyltransferase involved in cell wall biosynthesis